MTEHEFDRMIDQAADRFERAVEHAAGQFERAMEARANHLDRSLTAAWDGSNLFRWSVCGAELLAGVGLERPALEALVDKLSPEELAALSKAWRQQAGGRYPLKTQLRYEEQSHPVQERDGAFLI